MTGLKDLSFISFSAMANLRIDGHTVTTPTEP
jgi:hypothetical protein